MSSRRTPIRAEALFVRLYVLMVALAFGLGAAIVLGGTERMSGPSFTGMVDLAGWLPGPVWAPWGALFMGYGLTLIGALGRPIAVHVLRAGMVVYLFLVTGMVLAPLQEPKAALTGIAAYTVLFGCHALLSDHLTHRGWTEC